MLGLFKYIMIGQLLTLSTNLMSEEESSGFSWFFSKKEVVKDVVEEKKKVPPEKSLSQICIEELKLTPGKMDSKRLKLMCDEVKQVDICNSHAGRKIYHYDKFSKDTKALRILTIGAVHGDEKTSATVAKSWMERLLDISPRSTWRIIPVLNPDGYRNNTRTNGRGVDINRNFPSSDWDKLAHKYWVSRARKSKRRFPGKSAASELETKCAMKHINEFKPDLIIAIHTPLGILDFDGPKVEFPKFTSLPWRRLGHFPGSLGRYMWKDKSVPVLTIELKGSDIVASFKVLDHLQDVSGTLAILVNKKKDEESKRQNNHNHN